MKEMILELWQNREQSQVTKPRLKTAVLSPEMHVNGKDIMPLVYHSELHQ